MSVKRLLHKGHFSPKGGEDANAVQQNMGQQFNVLAFAGSIGLHMVSGVLVGTLVGYGLDEWLDTRPWLTGVFLFVGIAAGFNNVYRDAKRLITSQEWNTNDAGIGADTKEP